jgi:hypothetical protein
MALPAASLFEVPPIRSTDKKSYAFMVADLARSGLIPDDINAYPIKPHDLTRVPAYVIPFHNNPKMWTTRYDQAANKYIGPKGISDIWLPPQVTFEQLKQAQTIWVIEGEKKAAKFYKQFRLPTIGLRGCYGFCTTAYSNDGQSLLHPSLISILDAGKILKVIFDADLASKIDVQYAAVRLAKLVGTMYVGAEFYKTPEGKGADDWLVACPEGKITDLEVIPEINLQDTWKQIYKDTGCVMRTKDGVPVAPRTTESNAALLISHIYADKLSTDVYHGYIYDDQPINDIDMLRNKILVQLQRETQCDWSPRNIQIGLAITLANKQTNILADFIRALPWDGTSRLNTWASQYIETSTPMYTNEWGRLLITSMVLRILQPGSRVDYMYTLCGAQGIGKTTFFQELAEINKRSYYNQLRHVNRGGNGESLTEEEIFKASVLVDLDEGVYQKKADAEEVKSLITRPKGAVRQLYTKTIQEYPRACVFVSTGNKLNMLKDATGARRFMNITASKIHRMPNEVKYQLFAEVVAHEKELRKSDWYIINCEDETTDYELTEHEKSLSIQERHNIQYTQTDVLTEYLMHLFDNTKNMAMHIKTGAAFINVSYLNCQAQMSNLPLSSKAWLATKVAELAASPTFPFKLIYYRLRKPQLRFPNDNILQQYVDGMPTETIRDEKMFNGYLVQRK